MVRTGIEQEPWDLVLPSVEKASEKEIKEILIKVLKQCPGGQQLAAAISAEIMKVKFVDEEPVDYFRTRQEILKRVRSGNVPKGILKKWPLYLAVSPKHNKKIC
jgi:tRNA threonylcarbamoyladenosine modification (KEOPS) complex Cgi121 subunit